MPAWISAVTIERLLKAGFFLLLAAPLVMLLRDVAGELAAPGSRLGADPAAAVVDTLGIWAIRMLLLTLAVSTLRRWLNQPRVLRVRRMVGLFAFTYALLHVLAYTVLLAGFEASVLLEDLTERPYIIAGFTAFVLLVPLAITSTNGWRRRLGRRWVRLHRLVYAAMALAVVHFFWQTKDGFGEVILYAGVFAMLMAERVFSARRLPRRRSAAA